MTTLIAIVAITFLAGATKAVIERKKGATIGCTIASILITVIGYFLF